MNKQTYAKPHRKIKNSKRENEIYNTILFVLIKNPCSKTAAHIV